MVGALTREKGWSVDAVLNAPLATLWCLVAESGLSLPGVFTAGPSYVQQDWLDSGGQEYLERICHG